FGVNYFAIPNRLSEGGVIGITIITYYLFGWSTGIVNFAINTILLIIGYKLFAKCVTWYTMISIVFSSIFLNFTESIGRTLNVIVLRAALFSGLTIGFGLVLIFRADGTSGGTAILARLANQYWGWG